MTATAATGLAFRLATAPARWLGRFRPDLLATVRADAATYIGPRASLFLLLVLIALGYTLALQVVHAVIGDVPRQVDPFDYVYRFYFTRMFNESLLYMTVVAGIGAFSPALGVMLVLVFIPADLVASAVAAYGLSEGLFGGQLTPLPGALLGRAITYVLLWILAVEIPIIVRRVERPDWATLRSVGWRAAATFVLVAMWSTLVPWLTRPAMIWTRISSVQDDVVAPLWQFWYFLAVGAALLAGLAAAIARNAGSTGYLWEADAPTRTRGPSAVRDWIWVIILAVLFAGFYDGAVEAALIIGTLILTLPVLSAVLPRVPVPGLLRGGSLVVRFVIAMVVTGFIGWAFTTVGSSRVEIDAQLAGPIIVAITAPIFRIIVELGWRPPARAETPSAASAAVTATMAMFVVGLLWIALPAVALAGDCPDDKGMYCLANWVFSTPLLVMAAGALLTGAALWPFLSEDWTQLAKDLLKTHERAEQQKRFDDMLKEPPPTADDFKNAPPAPGKRSGRRDPPSGG